MMPEHAGTNDRSEYAWAYFELHARQRMAVFNYFVLIAGLLTAALAGSLGKNGGYHLISLVLAFSLVIMSFVFWKLDQRVRHLIKHAEGVLKTLETRSANNDTTTDVDMGLFTTEEETTAKLRTKLRKKYRCRPWNWHMSYYECFCVVYIVFGVIGGLGLILTIAGLLS